jgi:NRPS condensation-like uncharacterized protein
MTIPETENRKFYPTVPWDILQLLFKTEKINNHVLHFSGICRPGLSLSKLKQAVSLLCDAFPLIRCNLRMVNGKPVWYDEAYTCGDIVTFIETDNCRTERDKFLMQEIDEQDGPQMKVALLKSSETDELCVIMNHMLCDAAGFKDVLYRLASLYSALESKSTCINAPMIKERSVAQIFKTLTPGQRLRIYLKRGTISPQGMFHFCFESCPDSPFIESRIIPPEQFALIREYAKAHRASVNDVVMTACIRVLSGIFGKPDILPCAIDVRRFLPRGYTADVCNLVTNLPCSIGQELPVSFTETLEKVKFSMDSQKNDPACMKNLMMLELLFKILPYRTARFLLKKAFTNPPVAFTNIGTLDKGKLVFGYSEMKDAFMTGSIKYQSYFQLSLSTFDSKAVFCVNLYGTEKDRTVLSAFLDSFIRELTDGTNPGHETA